MQKKKKKQNAEPKAQQKKWRPKPTRAHRFRRRQENYLSPIYKWIPSFIQANTELPTQLLSIEIQTKRTVTSNSDPKSKP